MASIGSSTKISSSWYAPTANPRIQSQASRMKRNAFDVLTQGAIAHPDQDHQVLKRQMAKRARLEKADLANKEHKRKQQEANRAAQRTNWALRKAKMGTGSWNIPQKYWAEGWTGGLDNAKHQHLQITMIDTVNKRIKDIHPRHREDHTLPPDLQPNHATKNKTGPDGFTKYGAGDKSVKPRQFDDSAMAPVIQMTAVDDKGCPVSVRVHKFRSHNWIKCPTNWAEEIGKECLPGQGKRVDAIDALTGLSNSVFRLPLPNDHQNDPKPTNDECIQKDEETAKEQEQREAAESAYWGRMHAKRAAKMQVVRQERDQILANSEVVQMYCEQFQVALEKRLQDNPNTEVRSYTGDLTQRQVLKVEMKARQSMFYFDNDEQEIFMDITYSLPEVQQRARKILAEGILVESENICISMTDFFNATLALDVSFMVERNLAGMAWITCPRNRYHIMTGILPEQSRLASEGKDYARVDPDEEANKAAASSAGMGMSTWKMLLLLLQQQQLNRTNVANHRKKRY